LQSAEGDNHMKIWIVTKWNKDLQENLVLGVFYSYLKAVQCRVNNDIDSTDANEYEVE